MNDVGPGHINRDLLTLFIVGRLAEGDVEDAKDLRSDHAGGRYASTRRIGPLLDTEKLVLSNHRTQQLQTALEDPLHEGLALAVDGIVHEREQRNETLGRDLTLRAEIGQERCDRVRQTLSLKEAHNVTTTTASPLVLDLLLLNLVEQIKRLVEVASVSTAEIGALQDTNLTCLRISVLVQQDVQLRDGVSRPNELLLNEVSVLAV